MKDGACAVCVCKLSWDTEIYRRISVGGPRKCSGCCRSESRLAVVEGKVDRVGPAMVQHVRGRPRWVVLLTARDCLWFSVWDWGLFIHCY